MTNFLIIMDARAMNAETPMTTIRIVDELLERRLLSLSNNGATVEFKVAAGCIIALSATRSFPIFEGLEGFLERGLVVFLLPRGIGREKTIGSAALAVFLELSTVSLELESDEFEDSESSEDSEDSRILNNFLLDLNDLSRGMSSKLSEFLLMANPSGECSVVI